MESGRVPFRKILFVCINRRPDGEACCAAKESEAVAEALKSRVKALRLGAAVRVSKSGCQDLCAKGPNVMVFPDYVWYRGVTPADAERILDDALRGLNASSTASAE